MTSTTEDLPKLEPRTRPTQAIALSVVAILFVLALMLADALLRLSDAHLENEVQRRMMELQEKRGQNIPSCAPVEFRPRTLFDV